MDCNMKVLTISAGERYTCFISKQYEEIENDKIEEGVLLGMLDPERSSLNNININLDPFAYHPEKRSDMISNTWSILKSIPINKTKKKTRNGIFRDLREN